MPDPAGIDLLATLSRRRWNTPVLAALGSDACAGRAGFNRLVALTGAPRDSLVRALQCVTEPAWVRRPEPGAEYVLTPRGRPIAAGCRRLEAALDGVAGAVPPAQGPAPPARAAAYRRWVWPLLHRLSDGPQRFNALRAGLPGITPRALTLLLRDLSDDTGWVRRTTAPGYPPVVLYSLDTFGRRLAPILERIAAIGEAVDAD
jgi:DNA-binding HxlR family transcriptional regulator